MNKESEQSSKNDYIKTIQHLIQTMDKKEIIKIYRLVNYYSFGKGAVSHGK